MKYIDAEKLLAKIKGLQCEQGFDTGEAERAYQSAIKDILAFIDTLQQEQPRVDLVAKLKHHLATTPKEQLEKEWKELEPWNNIGPTVQEFLYGKQPEGNLEYWLEHFGMPKENIDNCITQIAQGYGACRYLEGIQHGAEAVNELAKQEQPEVDLEEYLSAKLFFLGADLIRHKPYSFNRGLNVGMTKAYDDILKKINVKKEK